jgi:hypothetical protein
MSILIEYLKFEQHRKHLLGNINISLTDLDSVLYLQPIESSL